MTELLRLVYASHCNFEPSSADGGKDSVVIDILAQSRRNNAPLQIGGGLCFGDGAFLQCLEGERGPVEQLYDRLLNDPRHRDVTLLSKRPVTHRLFKPWSMKFINVDARIRSLLSEEKLDRFQPHRLSDALIERLLVAMRDAPEPRRPVLMGRQGRGASARQLGAAGELMPGLIFATAAAVIAIFSALMLAGLL